MAWDDNKSAGDEITDNEWDNHVNDQKGHNTRHENDGSDEIDVGGLSGVLADRQKPQKPTEPIGGIKVVERYNGGDAETRLTNAISDAADGDTLILERGQVYNNNRTIGKEIALRGADLSTSTTSGVFLSGGTWTLNAESTIDGIGIFDTTDAIDANSEYCTIQDVVFFDGGSITVGANNVIISKIKGPGTVTFEGGTSGGEIGIKTGDLTVTDNGSNSTL